MNANASGRYATVAATDFDGAWEVRLAALNAVALTAQVVRALTEIEAQGLADEGVPVNHRLPIRVGEWRQLDSWRVALVLTPWMLARMFFPTCQPAIALPRGWTAADRRNGPLTIIGPAVSLAIPGVGKRAHIQFHPRLGHYLIQPLIQSMQRFASVEAVDLAWEQLVRQCRERKQALQGSARPGQAISRRGFFSRLARLG